MNEIIDGWLETLRAHDSHDPESALLHVGMLVELWFRQKAYDSLPEAILPPSISQIPPSKTDRELLCSKLLSLVSDETLDPKRRLRIASILAPLRQFSLWKGNLELLVHHWDDFTSEEVGIMVTNLAPPFLPEMSDVMVSHLIKEVDLKVLLERLNGVKDRSGAVATLESAISAWSRI